MMLLYNINENCAVDDMIAGVVGTAAASLGRCEPPYGCFAGSVRSENARRRPSAYEGQGESDHMGRAEGSD